MRPLCCVTMPFGKKLHPMSQKPVDFDLIYRDLIAPAVAGADLDPFRLDDIDQTGGSIHRTGFEAIVFSDFVVADVSFGNPNVNYDLGVRHSFQPRGTILLFQTGSRLPFNIT